MIQNGYAPEYTGVITRFEDMSRKGKLMIHRQADGDIVLCIHEADRDGEIKNTAAVEFCTYSGGGQSQHTFDALVSLIEAMKKDNEERQQQREG